MDSVAPTIGWLTCAATLTAAQGSDALQSSWLFDYDDQWQADKHFVRYDYRQPLDVPPELHHTFGLVVIDP